MDEAVQVRAPGGIRPEDASAHIEYFEGALELLNTADDWATIREADPSIGKFFEKMIHDLKVFVNAHPEIQQRSSEEVALRRQQARKAKSATS